MRSPTLADAAGSPDDPARPDGFAPDRHAPHARRPGELAWRDRWTVARRVVAEARQDQLPLLAAGVAFWALLAAVPALVAVASVYGLVTDPTEALRQLDEYVRLEGRRMLGREADVLRVRALCALGNVDEAREVSRGIRTAAGSLDRALAGTCVDDAH